MENGRSVGATALIFTIGFSTGMDSSSLSASSHLDPPRTASQTRHTLEARERQKHPRDASSVCLPLSHTFLSTGIINHTYNCSLHFFRRLNGLCPAKASPSVLADSTALLREYWLGILGAYRPDSIYEALLLARYMPCVFVMTANIVDGRHFIERMIVWTPFTGQKSISLHASYPC